MEIDKAISNSKLLIKKLKLSKRDFESLDLTIKLAEASRFCRACRYAAKGEFDKKWKE